MLSGSVVVVTGAASGIGRATCELLLRTRDVKVVGVDLLAKDRKSGESLGRLLSTGRFELLQGDITDDKFRHTIASYVEGLGRCQGLVNAAGVYRLYAFPELTEKQLKLSMEVNFYAPLWLTRHLLPHLKAASPASVVNVTSCDRGAPGRTAYCSSKGALSSW